MFNRHDGAGAGAVFEDLLRAGAELELGNPMPAGARSRSPQRKLDAVGAGVGA